MFPRVLLSLSLFSAVAIAQPGAMEVDVNPSGLSLGDDVLPFNESAMPSVLTAVRLNQPSAEVPASVTVLDAEFIASIGARSLTDILRYVPGMMVAYDSLDNSDSVAYHGGPALFPKSMQVLIDGRSVYRSGISTVGWHRLPVAVEEIQRIEIVRGPNSTSYGTNAYQAVVSIITKHPQDSLASRVELQAGNNDDRYVYLRHGVETEHSNWRMNARLQHTDHLEDAVDASLGCLEPCADDRRDWYLGLRGAHSLSARTELDTALIGMKADRQVPNFLFTDNRIKDEHLELGLNLTHTVSDHRQVQATFYSMRYDRFQRAYVGGLPSGWFDPDLRSLEALNPQAADQIANGQSPTALDMTDPQQLALAQTLQVRYTNDPAAFMTPATGFVDANTTEHRTDIEIQDTWLPNDRLTLINGFGYRKERVSSKEFYDGTIDADLGRVFSNVNWRASDHWALHAGLMFEQEGDYESLLSTRLAANYLISPLESVRLVYTKGGKTPDYHEQHRYWSYRLQDMQTASPYTTDLFYEVAVGPGDLKHQTIEAFELGYHGQSSRDWGRFNWDAKIFHEQLLDVIYQYPSIFNEEVYLDNRIRYVGAEGQFTWSLSNGADIRLTSTLIDADADTEAGLDEGELVSLHAPVSHSLAWMQRWNARVGSSMTLFYVNNLGPLGDDQRGTNQRRLDLHLYRDIVRTGWSARMSLKAQRDFIRGEYDRSSQPYRQPTRVQLALGLSF